MEVLTDIATKIGFDWRLALTHLINFLIVFFLLVKFALPAVQKAIKERTQKIKEGLKMREEADKIVLKAESDAKEINKNANNKAESIISKSESNAKEIILNANDKASGIIQSATLMQTQAKEKGLKDAETILTKDISSIISKISNAAFGEKLNSENNSEFVSKIFKENYSK